MVAWIQAAGRDELLDAMKGWPLDAQREAFRCRFRVDSAWWVSMCLPDLITLPFNPAHLDILETLAALPSWTERVRHGWGEKAYSYEAPRGLAKTTLLKAGILHRICYGLEPFILWGGPGKTEAEQETEHLRQILSTPEEMLAWLYGPFTVKGSTMKWSVQLPDARHPIHITPKGMPKGKVRGINRFGQRPPFIVVDDLEHPETVRNPAQREKLATYLQSDVRNAGPKQGGLVFFQVGTRLHPDGQTARNATDPAFTSRRYQSILRWSHRGDLVERVREVWADRANPLRETHARSLYDLLAEEIEREVQVLDRHAQPYYTLLTLLWSRGRRSFFKDYQNDPQSDGETTFNMDRLRRCRFDGKVITAADGRTTELKDCRRAIWLDPRASKDALRNDFGAIAWLATDAHGYVYVLACSMKRDAPSGQRARLWAFAERDPEAAVFYEDNGFQALFGDDFERDRKERDAKGQFSAMRPIGVTTKDNKNDVIAEMEPDLDNGWLQVAEDLDPICLQQLRDHPGADHDDGPDAISKARRALRAGEWGVG